MTPDVDEEHRQEIAGSYYDGEIGVRELRERLGDEAAANVFVLGEQLRQDLIEELGRELAVDCPRVKPSSPSLHHLRA